MHAPERLLQSRTIERLWQALNVSISRSLEGSDGGIGDPLEEEDLTLVVSMHQLELAREYFPRMVGLKEGRVLFDRPAELLEMEEVKALYELNTIG